MCGIVLWYIHLRVVNLVHIHCSLETLILSGNQLSKLIVKDANQFPSLHSLSLIRNLINEVCHMYALHHVAIMMLIST